MYMKEDLPSTKNYCSWLIMSVIQPIKKLTGYAIHRLNSWTPSSIFIKRIVVIIFIIYCIFCFQHLGYSVSSITDNIPLMNNMTKQIKNITVEALFEDNSVKISNSIFGLYPEKISLCSIERIFYQC